MRTSTSPPVSLPTFSLKISAERCWESFTVTKPHFMSYVLAFAAVAARTAAAAVTSVFLIGCLPVVVSFQAPRKR